MTPGFPVHHFDLDDYDPEQCAAWMLGLVDDSPDKLAIVKIPPHRDDDDLGQLEALFSTAYDIAKDKRPDLSVKILHSVETHNGMPRDRLAVAIHEHKWVAGACVNGCPDTRPVDGDAEAA